MNSTSGWRYKLKDLERICENFRKRPLGPCYKGQEHAPDDPVRAGCEKADWSVSTPIAVRAGQLTALDVTNGTIWQVAGRGDVVL